jgi:hypothetical protein
MVETSDVPLYHHAKGSMLNMKPHPERQARARESNVVVEGFCQVLTLGEFVLHDRSGTER